MVLALAVNHCGHTESTLSDSVEPRPSQEGRGPHGPNGHHVHRGGPHRFVDAEVWAKRFDDPGRDTWQRPDQVIAALSLTPDAEVADLGAGTGYFSVRIAKALDPDRGHVWAVDIEPTMVRYIIQRATQMELPHVLGSLAVPDDPLLPTQVDRILIVDTYHHIDNRISYMRQLANRLKPGGLLAIVDFKKGQLPVGPPDAMKLSSQTVGEEMKQAGYRLKIEHTFLPYQYFLIFSLASAGQ